MTDGQYICVRDCFHGGRLFKAGDAFEPTPITDKPNKHFVLNGTPENPAEAKKVYTAGDDQRTTKELRADVMALAEKLSEPKPARNASRKKLWMAWVDLCTLDERPISPDTPAPAVPKKEDGQVKAPSELGRPRFDNPILNKPFAQMTPDDIDSITAREICEKAGRAAVSSGAESYRLKKV
jgi:hypothetical protein